MPQNEPRFYRTDFNTERFRGFQVKYLETDLWIGVDPDSFRTEMKEAVFSGIRELRLKLDSYIKTEPEFTKTLEPFQPMASVPPEALEMADASAKAGVGPLASVAGLFARKAGETLLNGFSVNELVVENGGDIFAFLKDEIVLSVYAGDSPLSGKTGLVITPEISPVGICTSAGTVGHSLSFGKADAVVVISRDILAADAFATAFGNMVKVPEDVEEVVKKAENYPEILSLLIICKDKLGILGRYEIKILK